MPTNPRSSQSPSGASHSSARYYPGPSHRSVSPDTQLGHTSIEQLRRSCVFGSSALSVSSFGGVPAKGTVNGGITAVSTQQLM